MNHISRIFLRGNFMMIDKYLVHPCILCPQDINFKRIPDHDAFMKRCTVLFNA